MSPRQGEVDHSQRQRRTEFTVENSTIVDKKKEKTKKGDPFAEMEEYNGIFLLIVTDGRMIGEGVLQIPSYKCTLAFDSLNELREEFWTGKRHSHVWLILKSCCETDACKI